MINKKLLLVAIIFLAAGCNRTTEVIGLPHGTVQIADRTLNVQIAQTESTREQGLSGTASLADNDGMIFLFPTPNRYGFWMKDMNYPLDFIWIVNNQVAEITTNVQPQPGVVDGQLTTYYPQSAVESMVEVNAGWAQKYLVQVGDMINLSR